MKKGARRGNAFYGDTGTVFNGPAREQIEEDLRDNSSHGDTMQTGNDVDIAQRYAQSEDDGYMEQAERMMRNMERSDAFKYSGQFSDPDKRREFVEGLAEMLRNPNGNGQRPAPQAEPREEGFSSEKFWSDPEEVQRAAKQVRPRKL